MSRADRVYHLFISNKGLTIDRAAVDGRTLYQVTLEDMQLTMLPQHLSELAIALLEELQPIGCNLNEVIGALHRKRRA